MAKNEQSREANQPIWFDGKSINEALFCDDFLSRHKIIYTNGAFFTPDGRVTDDLPLRSEIFDELRCCAVSNIPRKISNIVELMKLAALVEDFPRRLTASIWQTARCFWMAPLQRASRRLFAVVCRWPTIPVLPHQPAGWRFWMGCFTRRTFRLCRNISATA